jgi:four helix bundle protein
MDQVSGNRDHGMNREELKKRTKNFALRIMKLCDSLPSKTSSRAIASQLVRSGTSVAANYRAAQRGRSKAEFIAKVGICLEESDESSFWLELLQESGLIKSSLIDDLKNESEQLTTIFYTIIRSAKQKP